MDIDECKRKGLIRYTKPNREIMKSLFKMSNNKENTVKEALLNEMNISVYLCDAYDALRQILEIIAISKGYNVVSHLCLGELIRELITEFDYKNFDRFRWIRNGVNYYGAEVELKQGKEIIKKIFDMKKRLVNKYLADI